MAKSAAKSKSSSGIVINRDLLRNKKFLWGAAAVLVFLLLYTKIIQVETIDHGIRITYHQDKKERALAAIGEIKSTTSEQVDRVGK